MPGISHQFHLEAKDPTVSCMVEKWYNNQGGNRLCELWGVKAALFENVYNTLWIGHLLYELWCLVSPWLYAWHTHSMKQPKDSSYHWMSQQGHPVATTRQSSKLESKYSAQSFGIRMSKHTAQVNLSLFSFITLLYRLGEMIESQWVENKFT